MSAATLAWLFVIATMSQCLACLLMDRLIRRREQWSRQQWLRFELSAEVQRLGDERSKRDATNAVDAAYRILRGGGS